MIIDNRLLRESNLIVSVAMQDEQRVPHPI